MKKEVVGIIGGKGKMGQFFARFFEKNGYQVLIADKGTKLANTELAQQSDIVLISVPMDAVEAVIETVAPHVRKESLLMDVNSLKERALKKMLQHSKSAVLGCHPLFGPTNQLEGQVCVFCEGRGKKWQQKMAELFTKNGAEVRFLSAREHDELMAVVQGLMHFLDITTTKTLQKTGIPIQKFFDFRSPSYRLKLDLMGRTLYQDAKLYGNIQIQNDRTTGILKKFLASAQELLETVEQKDLSAFRNYWNEAKSYLGDFAEVCQSESDELIDFLSAAHAVEPQEFEQKTTKGSMGILGPANTFSHLAAQTFFSDTMPLSFFRSIPEVFTAFKKKELESMLVPIENKLHGSVRETMDGLFQCEEPLQAMFRLPIHFVLAALPGAKAEHIQRISSHSQALAQCSNFLQSRFGGVQLQPVSSTAIGIAELIQKADPQQAIICSPAAARNAGLKVLAENIANTEENETWFAFLSHSKKKFTPKKSFQRSSIVFYFDQDSPGSLASVLKEFSQANINLTKIESRPAGHVFGDYLFFIDFEGSMYNSNVQEVFERVEGKVAKLKILGSYPVISEL